MKSETRLFIENLVFPILILAGIIIVCVTLYVVVHDCNKAKLAIEAMKLGIIPGRGK